MIDNNRLDDFIRNKVGNKSFEYNEAHWKDAESLISESEKGGKGGLYLTGTALMLMLLGSIGLAIHLNAGTEAFMAEQLSVQESTGKNAVMAEKKGEDGLLATLDGSSSMKHQSSSPSKGSENSFANRSNIAGTSVFLNDLNLTGDSNPSKDEANSQIESNQIGTGTEGNELSTGNANEEIVGLVSNWRINSQANSQGEALDNSDASEKLSNSARESVTSKSSNSQSGILSSSDGGKETNSSSKTNGLALQTLNENEASLKKENDHVINSTSISSEKNAVEGELRMKDEDDRVNRSSNESKILRSKSNSEINSDLKNVGTSELATEGRGITVNENAEINSSSEKENQEFDAEDEGNQDSPTVSQNLENENSGQKVPESKSMEPSRSKSKLSKTTPKKASRKLMKKLVAVSKTVGSGLGVHAGFNYLQAWEINSLTDGLNFSPTIGIVSNYQLNRRTEFEFGLSYMWRSGVSALIETEATDFDFGFRKVRTSYEVNNLNYFDIPVTLRYSLDRKLIHSVEVGLLFSQLASLNRKITVAENNSLGTATSEVNKELFQAEGFRSNDVALMVGYVFNVSRKVGINIDLRMGLLDNTDDKYFELQEYDRNFGISTGIKILPFRE